MKTINKIKAIFFSCFFTLIISNKAEAQGEERGRIPGYVYPTLSTCPVAATYTANLPVTNAYGVKATDNPDLQVLPGSCNQQAEVHISIDKNNPKFIIASANVDGNSTNGSEQGYYYSTDGGATWQGSDVYPNLPVPSSGNDLFSGDPCTAFDANGNAFVSTLEFNFAGFYVINSFDGTPWPLAPALPTWNAPTTTPLTNFYTPAATNIDKEMIVVDNFINSPNINNMYCVGTEFTGTGFCDNSNFTSNIKFFSNTSTTANNTSGNSFTPSATTPDLRNSAPGYGNGANVQTGPGGEVFVCWADYPTGTVPAGNIGFAYSQDAGTTWPVQTTAAFATGVGSSGYTGGVTYNCTQLHQHNPDGFNPNANILFGVASQTNVNGVIDGTGYIRINDYPTMAVDKSCGPNSGRVYIAFPEQDPNVGTFLSVIAVSYLDRGNLSTGPYTGSWSTPVVVNVYDGNLNVSTANPNGNNPNGLPYHNASHSFFPAITVDDATGIVSVAYYSMDANDWANHTNSTNTYVAFSSDGGNNFNNIQVSDVAHLTAPIPGDETYAGDYIGIAAYGGKAYAAWSDNRIPIAATTGHNASSFWQIYVSEIDYSGYTSYNTVANNLTVNGPISISSGQTATYRSVKPIIVTGNNSTFQTASGSFVDISSCQEVQLTDGFSAQNDLHAYITCQTCYTVNPTIITDRLTANNSNGSPPKPQSIKPDFSTSQLGTDIKVGIFPNPSTGLVYLNMSAQNKGNVVTTITDVNGRIVANNIYSAEVGANSFKLDLSNLQNGVYAICVTDAANNIIKRDKIILTKQE